MSAGYARRSSLELRDFEGRTSEIIEREFRVRQGRIRMVMAQQRSDGVQGEASLHQVGRQSVAKHMRSSTGGWNLRLVERASDEGIDAAAPAECHGGTMMPHEDLTRVCLRTASSQVGHQRLRHGRRERKDEWASSLRPSRLHDARSPIDIIEAEVDDFARAEAVDGKEQEHRIASAANRRSPIDTPQQLLHLLAADRGWKGREPVPSRALDTTRPVVRHTSGALQVLQEPAQDLNHL
jgi:hypothetical protein